MAEVQLIDPAALRQLLRYDPVSGKLFWLERAGEDRATRIFNGLFAGREAFTFRMPKGHLQGRIHRKSYLAHRVVWALVHGRWPADQIDHINGNPADNRISNLREVMGAENQRNMKRSSRNTSGVSGVDWQPDRGMWRVRVNVRGKSRHLGRFRDFGDAVEARKLALSEHDYHPNHGRARCAG